jgi:hypothetical protein
MLKKETNVKHKLSNMKNIRITVLFLAIVLTLAGCSGMMTRTEYDLHTITERDTTYNATNQNAPGNRDNGIIYPSSRVFNFLRSTTTKDSLEVREYPDFIRLGVFESVGLMFSGENKYSMGLGLFGIFPDFDNLNLSSRELGKTTLFQGGLYRFGIGEWRLRWFKDAKDWTYGTSLLEIIAPDSRGEKSLSSIFPLYVKKRYYLREEIPYISIAPGFGFGWFPSQYINLFGALEIGSLGGFNLRAYLGIAAGINQNWSVQVRSADSSGGKSQSSIIPYLGIGISFLDFVNIVPETYREWKDHEHSSWNIGLLQIGILNTPGTDSSSFATDNQSSVISGLSLRVLHGEVAIPILNNKFYAGTSLFNLIVLGDNEWGMGVLPIRIGYWQDLIQDELTTEPFIEFNYYPSTFIHLGNKINLKISNEINFGLTLGYVNGSTDIKFGNAASDLFGISSSMNNFYIGINFGIVDRIFTTSELRYNKK